MSDTETAVTNDKMVGLANLVQEKLGAHITQAVFQKDELCITIQRKGIVPFLIVLRDDKAFQFKQLVDICGADYPDRPERFDVIYNLLSLAHNIRIRVKVQKHSILTVLPKDTIKNA